MNEKENLDIDKKPVETPTPENMDYSFDFANQVSKEEEAPATPVETLTPQPETPVAPVETLSADETPVAPEPQLVDVSVPVLDETAPVAANPEPPVAAVTPEAPVQTEAPVQATETEEPTKSGKSTIIFIIVLLVLVAAFIIALPFLRNLG